MVLHIYGLVVGFDIALRILFLMPNAEWSSPVRMVPHDAKTNEPAEG